MNLINTLGIYLVPLGGVKEIRDGYWRGTSILTNCSFKLFKQRLLCLKYIRTGMQLLYLRLGSLTKQCQLR